MVYPRPPQELFEYPLDELDWADKDLRLRTARVRPGPHRYSQLKLVGHSLGAVVVRQLVVDQVLLLDTIHFSLRAPDAQKVAPAANARLFLFAPAHGGFEPSGAKGALLAASSHFLPFRVLWSLVRGYRAYGELQAGSATLIDLKEATETLARKYPRVQGLSARILWGKLEDVVRVTRFECDHSRAEIFVDGKGHADICKPNAEFLAPFEFVETELGAYAGD